MYAKARAPCGATCHYMRQELDRIEDLVAGAKESVIEAGELNTFPVHVRVVQESVLARMQLSHAGGALAAMAKSGQLR